MLRRGDGRRMRWPAHAAGALMALAMVFGTAPSSADQCPYRFNQLTTGLLYACAFIGSYDAACNDEPVALFAGDGTALVVGLSLSADAPPVFIAAQTLSPTEGKVVLWRPDLQLEEAPSMGSVRLEDDGGRLVVQLQTGPVIVGGCPLREFVGRFAGMAAAEEPAPEPIPLPIAGVSPTALNAARRP